MLAVKNNLLQIGLNIITTPNRVFFSHLARGYFDAARFFSLYNKMNKKASEIKESMSKKKKSVKETIEEYKTINLKLNNGLDVSLNIIVDLSKMLKHYHDLLSAIQTFVDEPIDLADDVKDLAAKAYGKLTSTFNEQIDDVISAYDSDSEEIGKLQAIKKKINKALQDNIEDEEDEEVEEEEKIRFSKKKKKDEEFKFT